MLESPVFKRDLLNRFTMITKFTKVQILVIRHYIITKHLLNYSEVNPEYSGSLSKISPFFKEDL